PAAQRGEHAPSGAAHRPRPAREQQRQVRSGRFSRLGAGDRRTPHAPATGARERGSAERSVSMKRLGRWLLVALALGGGGSCSSDAGTGPVAGVLTASRPAANAGLGGAIRVRFTGP